MMPVINGAVLAITHSLGASIVVKMTVMTTLGLVAYWLTRRNRAAVRHAAIAATFGATLLLPIASIVAPPVHVAVPVRGLKPAALPLVANTIDAVPALTGAADGLRVTHTAPQLSKFSVPVFVLLSAWIIGTLISLLPLVTGVWQIRVLRRTGLPWLHGRLIAETLALGTDIHRRVEVLLHGALPGPITCGVLYPAIVLPLDAQTWKGEDLNRAIVHELEHVRRRDSVSRGLARAVCALYWFHPLIWVAWRKLVLEAERSCDDAVLRCSEATAYAHQLVGLAKRLPTAQRSPLLAMANRSDLATRVAAVLAKEQRRGRAGRAPLAVACFAAAALVFAISPLTLVGAPQATSDKLSPSAGFDVISVRRNVSGAKPEVTPPLQYGRLRFTNVTVQAIMSLAFYPLDFDHIKGTPAWTSIGTGERYDIEATTEERVVSEERYHQMLQLLLAERFQLKFHWETHEEPVYLLVPDKKGLKLKATDPSSCEPVAPEVTLTPNGTACGRQYRFSSSGGGLHLEGIGMTMKTLAVVLGLSGRPVIDRTGYEGMVDIKLDFTPANRLSAAAADGPPSIFDALPDQLGLRLQPGIGPVDEVIIDHIERPSEN